MEKNVVGMLDKIDQKEGIGKNGIAYTRMVYEVNGQLVTCIDQNLNAQIMSEKLIGKMVEVVIDVVNNGSITYYNLKSIKKSDAEPDIHPQQLGRCHNNAVDYLLHFCKNEEEFWDKYDEVLKKFIKKGRE